MTVDDYEGALEVERAWREGLRPDPRLTVSEWAECYRMLSTKESAEPGRWRNARTPYLREIMDCLSAHSPVRHVAFMKGAQIGGTEMGLNFLGYVIHNAPNPTMAVYPPSLDVPGTRSGDCPGQRRSEFSRVIPGTFDSQ